MLKKIRNFIVNPFYLKVFFVITSFLLVTTVTRPYVDGVIKFGILWAAIVFFYDLFTERRVLKSHSMLLLVGFLVVFGTTILINYKVEFKNNISSWLYTVCMLLVLYPYKGIHKEQALHEISVLNYTYLGLTCIGSTISFILFLKQTTYWGEYYGLKYCIGVYDNRLFGIYLNPGIVLTSVAICLSIIQFFINHHRNEKRVGIHVFLAYSFIINFVCMALENSKGAFIGMAAVCGFLCAFRFWKLLQNKKILLRSAACFCIILVSVGLFFGVISLSRSGLSYLPPLFMQNQVSETKETQPSSDKPSQNNAVSQTEIEAANKEDSKRHASQVSETKETQLSSDKPSQNNAASQVKIEATNKENSKGHVSKVEMDRTEIPDNYGVMTGRPIIWRFGFTEFAKRPLLGYGPNYHTHVQVLERPLSHFHNLIVQCLVSVGSIGSFFILLFLALQFCYLLRRLFSQNSNMLYASIFALLFMLGINSMAEVTILFLIRPTAFVFWIYLGYLMAMSDSNNEKISLFDKPFYAVDQWLTKKTDIIKNRKAIHHGKK